LVKRLALKLVLLSLLVTLIGCDYRLSLSGGFQIVRFSSGDFCLVDESRRIVVGPTIVGYKELNHLVVGNAAPLKDGSDWCLHPGYFLVDTQTNERLLGLSREQWVEALEKRGVSSPPKLYRPNRLRLPFSGGT
jgi:hypothetical protein